MSDKKMLADNFITFDNKDYYTTEVFAELTDRSTQSLRLLVSKGNRVRKLKASHIGSNLYINKEELTDYPFTCPGKSKLVYYYDAEGNATTAIIN